jgi:hypothetical protein
MAPSNSASRRSYQEFRATHPPIKGGDQTLTAEDLTKEIGERRTRHDALLAEITPLLTEQRTARSAYEARLAHADSAQHPSEEERTQFAASEERFNESLTAKLAELRNLAEQIERDETFARSLRLAQNASAGTVEVGDTRMTVTEPLTYRRDNQSEFSYFLDLAAHQNQEVRGTPNRKLEGYQERMERHSKEMADIMPKRWQSQKRQAEAAVDQADQDVRSRHGLRKEVLNESPFTRQEQLYMQRREIEGRQVDMMESRAPSRIVGQGGYAIPPLWLIDDYIPALRPGRVAAGLCRQMPLPEGTDSINIPRLLTPTLTGIQTADAAPVVSRDFSDTFQQANVKTIAGQEDVPIQLIEQSPGQILDRVLMTDLIADYNKQLDLQVLVGNGTGASLSGGQVVGMYPAANWGANTVSIAAFGNTTTTSAPYVPPQAEFFQFLGAMASKTAYNRFNLLDFNYVMHPRRWFWAATGLDTGGKTLVTNQSGDFGPYSSQALEPNLPYEGYAGRVPFGANVYIDANVPITDNGSGASGGSNDVAIGAIWDDCWLFEGDLRTRVLAEVLSGTLELRFQVTYVAQFWMN